jgi:predicted NodU family carbamoyl transferase
MIILGISNGHDASASLLIDGRLEAYCKQEWLSRRNQEAGAPLRFEAISEVLETCGVRRGDIDVVAMDRGRLPVSSRRRVSRPLDALRRRLLGYSPRVLSEMARQEELNELDLVDAERVRRLMGLWHDAAIRFTNHHYAHALGAFKFTTWERDAL